jgi:hypothetical protein
MNPNFLPVEFVLPLTWERARQVIVDRETRTSDAINTTDSGYYTATELLNGQTYIPSNKENSALVWRKVIDFGSLPNASTKTVAHGITGITTLMRMFGSATATNAYLPIPNTGIEMSMDNTNIIITTTTDRTAYTCIVVVEYLKT